MTTEPYEYERVPLSERLTAYYRDVVAIHADDPVVGACLVCRVPHCEDWRSASERLGSDAERPIEPVLEGCGWWGGMGAGGAAAHV